MVKKGAAEASSRVRNGTPNSKKPETESGKLRRQRAASRLSEKTVSAENGLESKTPETTKKPDSGSSKLRRQRAKTQSGLESGVVPKTTNSKRKSESGSSNLKGQRAGSLSKVKEKAPSPRMKTTPSQGYEDIGTETVTMSGFGSATTLSTTPSLGSHEHI